MGEYFEIKKDYRDDKDLRTSFNKLAQQTFGLQFETWYQNGYWTDKYNPYSVIINNKVVANVSVNKMEFNLYGERQKYLQLGTVMTDIDYRNKGFIKKIMEQIDFDYLDHVDGIYLFSNASVLDFYPKFGYRKSTEYQYELEKSNARSNADISLKKPIQQLHMKEKNDWEFLGNIMESSLDQGVFEMKDNKELILFYVTQFMQNDVYYMEEEEAYIIAQISEDTLFLHNIFSNKKVNIDHIIEAFGEQIKKVIFGFTPQNVEGYQGKILCKEDTTLFVKGKAFDEFGQKKCIFPMLSHA